MDKQVRNLDLVASDLDTLGHKDLADKVDKATQKVVKYAENVAPTVLKARLINAIYAELDEFAAKKGKKPGETKQLIEKAVGRLIQDISGEDKEAPKVELPKGPKAEEKKEKEKEEKKDDKKEPEKPTTEQSKIEAPGKGTGL